MADAPRAIFPVLSADDQLAAFDRAMPPRPMSKAMRARLRRSIERDWTIFDPRSNKLQLTDAGRAAIEQAKAIVRNGDG